MKTVNELREEQDANPTRSRFKGVITPEEDERRPSIRAARENIPVYTPGRNHLYPANRYVINSIDWTLIDATHPLHDGRPQHQHDAETRGHIRRYAATRGAILHSLIEGHQSSKIYSDALDGIHDQLDALDNNEEHHEAYEAVAGWDASPRTDPDDAPVDALDALRQAARMEADSMETEWLKWCQKHEFDILSREHIYAHSPDSFRSDRGHGGQADLLINVPQGSSLPAPAGLYGADVKTSPDLHHAHRLQAEAHRRALGEKIRTEVGGMLLRVSLDGVDVETHHSDEWPSDALWTTFCEKLHHLYDETLLEVILTIGDEA